jgi:hypothetical protein
MGFNKTTWKPGLQRNVATGPRFKRVTELRRRRERRAQENIAARTLGGSLISLAALVGSDVKDPEGNAVGKLKDVIVRWTTRGDYPPATAIVVRTGKRDTLVGARWFEISSSGVRLRSSKAYVGALERHPADVALAHDVLDRQVVDAGGIQIVRPADVYLAAVHERIELVAIEVGVQALLRRLGPKRFRGHVRPKRVIDWASVGSFAPSQADDGVHRGRRSDIAGRAGSGLALGVTAAEIKHLKPSEVEAALQAAETGTEGGSR